MYKLCETGNKQTSMGALPQETPAINYRTSSSVIISFDSKISGELLYIIRKEAVVLFNRPETVAFN